ncbi:MAG: YcgL domain-containing protein [Gammaproteobacteria bacterium]
MQCYIYKSLKKEELYLYINNKDDFSDVPEPLLKSFRPMQFVMDLELTEGRKLAREDTGKVMASLKSKGYFVQMPPTVVPAPNKIQ